ncbi:MAG: hypothetical protein BWY85_00911 [Firmicutes bacterium ADurb.Bin506]|nr:MAG: hypothetical protein BWY85_00911 [Firmicutes bacterium ADurb.Bin506]
MQNSSFTVEGSCGDMLILTAQAFERARDFIKVHARGIDQALFAYLFEAASPDDVIRELSKYQNADGGFGRWLESDFAVPASSAAATVVGFEYLVQVDAPPSLETVRRAVDYLIATYDRDQGRWHAVPREINDYPHAPWWHYNDAEGGCLIDRSPGNPSAEIVGYLNRYRELVPPAFFALVTADFVGRLRALPDSSDSMHEILCYLRMTENLPHELRDGCFNKLRTLVKNITETDPATWGDYGATPLFFVTSRHSPLVDLFPEALEANLDYLVSTQDADGSWKPNWSWGQYDEAWQEARRRWSGQLTVRNLKLLAEFDRLPDTVRVTQQPHE